MRSFRGARAGSLPAAVVFFFLLGASSCSRDGDVPATEAVQRLDHFFLARMDPPQSGWLLCDRFELTRGEYEPEGLRPDPDLPVVMISVQEFNAWADPRGLRAPTVAEWRALAGSPEANPSLSPLSRNTLDLGIGAALPVGVFERGRSPLGGYDFFGNVRELAGPIEGGRYLALGGSFATRAAGADVSEAVRVEAGDRADDLGVRAVADASTYLREQVLPAWQANPKSAGPALLAAARSWRADLRTGLAEQLRREGFPSGFVLLLAP